MKMLHQMTVFLQTLNIASRLLWHHKWNHSVFILWALSDISDITTHHLNFDYALFSMSVEMGSQLYEGKEDVTLLAVFAVLPSGYVVESGPISC